MRVIRTFFSLATLRSFFFIPSCSEISAWCFRAEMTFFFFLLPPTFWTVFVFKMKTLLSSGWEVPFLLVFKIGCPLCSVLCKLLLKGGCLCLCVCLCMHTHVHTPVAGISVFLNCFLPMGSLHWLYSSSPGFPWLCLPSAGLQVHATTTPDFPYMGPGNLNSGPQA